MLPRVQIVALEDTLPYQRLLVKTVPPEMLLTRCLLPVLPRVQVVSLEDTLPYQRLLVKTVAPEVLLTRYQVQELPNVLSVPRVIMIMI